MGSKNPIKEVIKGATDLVVAPIRETARAVGADGVVDLTQGTKNFVDNLGSGAIDLANNEKKKKQQQADAASTVVEQANQSAAASESQRQSQAAHDAIENERMASGSKSRTLLTGPAGLDDEEDMTISRKTLSGRR